jgi:hypothetical protein
MAVLSAEDRIVAWGGLNKDPIAPEWGTEVACYIDRAYWVVAWPQRSCASR